MARPTVLHDGFLIPNANDVSNPRMAEPDRVDFNTLAHPLWGVIEGCLVTVAGTTASTTGGTLLVNGALVTLRPGSVGLGIGGSQDRFDLIVADAGGNVTVIVGTSAIDPVFPDPPLNTTVLAAVFCPTGSTTLADNVVDKRKFINKALLTKIGTGESLIRNLNGTGNHYLLDGGGKATWENDTWMWRSAPETLKVHKHLILEGTLTAGGAISAAGDIASAGNVYGKNLHWGDDEPLGPLDPGTIWQDTSSGKIYIWRGNAWEELATTQAANPPGTVIQSFELPTVMAAQGWLPLDGRRITETQAPRLFEVTGLAHLIINDTPRYMNLPNAQKLVMLVDWDSQPGLKVRPRGSLGNTVALAVPHMPRHGHSPRSTGAGAANPTVTINRAGQHNHIVTGGSHGHNVTDPGHRHNGFELGNSGIASAVIALMWNGQNKIDALFNDRNHTYSVEAMDWTMPAYSGITINPSQGHVHGMDPNGDHDHIATVTGIDNHEHGVLETQVGDGTPFDITPEYLTVYSYIRT